jgi:uncharacterized membrane protein
MKPLLVLLCTFFIALLAIKVIDGRFDFRSSGQIAMSIMLIFTSIAHFAFTRGMTMMAPSFIPFKKTFVYLTGILEILFAIGLLLPDYQIITAWSLIIFFVLMLPANINAAIHHINYQKGTTDGNGPRYLFFRIPLQLLFIAWTYFSVISYEIPMLYRH